MPVPTRVDLAAKALLFHRSMHIINSPALPRFESNMQRLLDHFHSLESVLSLLGQPRYRADQVRKWTIQRRAGSFHEMTDLPASLRSELADSFQLFSSQIASHQQSPDGTEKLLLKFDDGASVECVLLRDGKRRSVCLSSQVGCAMGCVFCASGLNGVERNLTAGEIVEQLLQLQRLLPTDERISHIVMMGMGEPLANLSAVLSALQLASAPDGLVISPRRITISTVGLPAAIDRLSTLDCRYNLAISLHAADDALRTQLVPVNERVGIEPLLQAADRYFSASGRRLTFEYVLLAGINDSLEHANRLATLLRHRSVLLNVIPYNPVDGLPYKTPSAQSVASFREALESAGISVKFRRRKGDKINAACGQLRRGLAPSTQAPSR